ncbi:MAG TPA: ABC transporter permease subunit [Spirillospora sp.]
MSEATTKLSTDAAGTAAAPVRAPARRKTWGSLPVVPRRLALILILLLAWQAYVSFSGISQFLVVGPLEVARAMVEGIVDGDMLRATVTTLRLLLTGMLLGMAIAAVLTTLASWTKLGEDLLVLLTSMLNPLPAIAVLPLAILWFGMNSTSLVFVITNSVVWPIAINVSNGFRTVNPTVMAVGRNIGLSGVRIVKDVLIPAALPNIIAGLKTGWAFGWRTIIAAELVFGVAGGKGGLGFFINDARTFMRTSEVFAGLVTIAIIGIALELTFTWIERRTVIKWGTKAA